MKYSVSIIVTTIIFFSWAVTWRIFKEDIKRKISPRDQKLILLLFFFIIGALLYTYFATNGTFIWR
ncbi:hypothetical protein Pcar_3409 [Syntrophotalea carbinolica DSM 2380]|uniref:Uncharacterized protein n=1 Tax=Syntrophotalea carbinolica (strain DSM 2380 / NBRC 103641 / GraBd1) TaxID=338963 RepID=Q0C6B5_SYNC1|nr:hypothetical protein Pcar_3216 [Syntrophotalea carbinolica DSM 2380]ABI82023.1 hypothetical protein Pcar_3409 [Syntrophotalea carbinolica DSM 2380]